MGEIVTEKFQQNLYTDPSGQRKTNPTIFDELRWAMQHSQKPLEQTLQLISEFHGLWTGMSAQLMGLINSLSNANNKDYVKAAQSALNLFNSISKDIPSAVGRQNKITAGQMNVPLLREFVSRCQALHPSINNFIQLNIGKYPYFQQISESVCQHGQIVLSKSEIPPIDRLQLDGKHTMQSDSPLRRTSTDKLFKTCYTLVDTSSSLVNCLYLRGLAVENNMGLLYPEYGKGSNPMAHGHNFTMDGFNAKRGKDAIQPCISQASSKFGPTLQLVDTFFPVTYEIANTPQFFQLEAEGKSYVADKLNRPLTREPIIPIASDEKKTALS